MPTLFEQRLRTAAAADAGLAALLGASPFRWYDDFLDQNSAFPAIVINQISGSKVYSFNQRMATGWNRWQFTIWGGQFSAGAIARNTVEAALTSFLDQFKDGIGIVGLQQYPNHVINSRCAIFPRTDGPIYQQIVDVMMFSNDSL